MFKCESIGKPAYNSACILFFVRYPIAGMVKTRLAKSIGNEEAARMYALFVQRLIAGLQGVVARTGVVLRIVYDAASVDVVFSQTISHNNFQSKQSFLQNWLGPYSYEAQSNGDIGERMERAMQQAFDDGYERVILLGSDIPDFPMEHIEQALDALHHSPLSINPTEDGGYCLIGMHYQSFPVLSSQLFHNITWSTPAVFSQTMERLSLTSFPNPPHILPIWYDIDTVEDLVKIKQA